MKCPSHDRGQDCRGACCNCSGSRCCGNVLLLTAAEIELLQQFAELPFLPVARRRDSKSPIYFSQDTAATAEVIQSIVGLQQKQLIRVDYNCPLSNFDYEVYKNYPIHGSMALTAKGQQVLELLEIYGIEE